jgi:hypothetical protein
MEQLDADTSNYLTQLYMQIINLKILSTSLVLCLVALSSMQVAAVTYETQGFELSEIFNSHDSLSGTQLLVENKQDSNSAPVSGDIVIPGESEAQGEEKKCVTVCEEWGRDCIINPKTGQRKCRRMCKSFGQECL